MYTCRFVALSLGGGGGGKIFRKLAVHVQNKEVHKEVRQSVMSEDTKTTYDEGKIRELL
jgi:hypothetical protein